MIYITGDTHAVFKRFSKDNFPEQSEMTKEDFVIICGDFGGVWNKDTENPREKWDMDWLDSKPFTTLFVDGNHENYDRLYSYPVEEWHGGKVHKIRPSVIHLMRGQVFDICGKKFFTFGGAASHDIPDGILELDDPDYKQKKKELDERWALYRINHFSWWKEEMPSEEEMKEGRKNLAKVGYAVDYIITHCCSSSVQSILSGGRFTPDAATEYLEEIRNNTKFCKWFFGHYHNNINITEADRLLYERIVNIEES